MITFRKYIAFQCVRCGRWQGRENHKFKRLMNEGQRDAAINTLSLKCKYCRKTMKFRTRTKGVVVRCEWFDNPQAMTGFIIMQNRPRVAYPSA